MIASQPDSFDTTLSGIIRPGHQVASGRSPHSPYPAGSIEMQQPHFKSLGLDLSPFFLGTLNVDITPHQFKLSRPQWTFSQVKWSPHHAPETFSFTSCRLQWQQTDCTGLIYYPHPETKSQHFQSPSILELLMPEIPGIDYGDPILLSVNAQALIIL